jgi:hypothetical protein
LNVENESIELIDGLRDDSEVKSHSSIDRFLIVFHSPTGMAETGLLACRSEKTGKASGCSANT